MTAPIVYADVRTERVPPADLVSTAPADGDRIAWDRVELARDGIRTPGTLWEREAERSYWSIGWEKIER